MADALTKDMNAAVVCDLWRSGFCGLGSGARDASWVRGSPVAPLASFMCEVCPIVLFGDVT